MANQTENSLLRILLVDDDVDFAASMADILEIEGYPVTVAHSVSEAIEKVETFAPVVALVDIRIGRESGLDLVAKLLDKDPELTCITVTAYADTDTAIEALKTGVYDYLRKPFETAELFAVLRRCADRYKLLAEKKAADKAREESEARFKVAFDTSPDAIILAYPGGAVIDVNRGFEQVTGYRRDQVVGKDSQEIGLWKNPADRMELLELLQKFGQANNLQADFRLSDGQIRIGLVSARVVEVGGEQVGLFVVRDIHDLKEKEKAIMESEERFRGVVSNIPGAVYRCLVDEHWTVLFVSSPIKEISGYPPTDFVQNKVRSFNSIIHPADRDMVARQVHEAVTNNKPFAVEYRIIHADGSTRWVHERGRAVTAEDGTIPRIDGVFLDTTESKQAKLDLAVSEDRLGEVSREYSAVLEGIPDAIILVDPDLKIVWGNTGASQHFGILQDDLPGMECTEVWGCQATSCKNCIKQVFKTGIPAENVQRTSNGRVWGVKLFPVRSNQGEIQNVIQIASDMTEKSRLRDQASRSAHLAALGELAAGVAHEINNPTGMILLDMPLLKDALADLLPLLEKHEPTLKDEKIGGLTFERFHQEVPYVIDEIYEGAQRIKRIVEELKDFSRPSTGVLAAIDLNEVVQKAISLVRNPIKNATDHFTEKYSAMPLLFVGNSQRLEQVVVNLLLNACYAMPDRSGAICVETAFNEENDCVKVVIRDEGVGVDAESLQQITDPFFTSRRETGGTGLGLSVSSRIIDEHKGTLSFASELGKGMTVTVELPMAEKVTDNA
jgi:PAS domain S-box-containing protein